MQDIQVAKTYEDNVVSIVYIFYVLRNEHLTIYTNNNKGFHICELFNT